MISYPAIPCSGYRRRYPALQSEVICEAPAIRPVVKFAFKEVAGGRGGTMLPMRSVVGNYAIRRQAVAAPLLEM
jgi:hypothetical protein